MIKIKYVSQRGIQDHLLFLDRFKDLDDAPLTAIHINAFKNLAILSSTNFTNNFIVILITKRGSTR